jgi:hypothetical protein
MGLEIVELVASVEKAFDLKISDAAWNQLTTPRELADYVEPRAGKVWSRAEIEDVIDGLILSVKPKAVFNRDTDLRTIFP